MARKRADWKAIAYRWRQPGVLQPVEHPQALRLDDLLGIDRQKAELERNTRQFVQGLPANNALLWGSRGTGKSSLVKALLLAYAGRGLRLIECDAGELTDLPDIVAPLFKRPERFIVFADDLSFEANDPSFKALKALMDGSIAAAPDNVLIYATSNRRHLLPEFHSENEQAQLIGTEIHHGEAVEEKISLSERFGLWLSFYPFDQPQYLRIARHHLQLLGVTQVDDEAFEPEALRYALARGSRSGRVAMQFARDWAGRMGLQKSGR
jgi:uncharacterized protein